jgi:hypothetical protein
MRDDEDFKEGRRHWYLSHIGVPVVLGIVTVVVTLYVNRDQGGSQPSNNGWSGTAASQLSTTSTVPPTIGAGSTTTLPPPPQTTTASPPSSTSEPSSPASAAPVDGWYDLVEFDAATWGIGFAETDPVRIGTRSFPSSIVGYYQSSTSDDNNTATWTIAGKCTQFSVWVGKDADSPSQAGVGRFVVKADDFEIFSAEIGMNDGAHLVDLNITGKVRLTLFDARKLTDAKNAWGRPRVHCTSPPGA